MASMLVVDDERLTLDCFRYLFPKDQIALLTAETAAEGLQTFTRQRPDVVVLDIRLPDQSGLELFRSFHEIDPRVPIILITGHGTADTAIEAMSLGAHDYVVKPLDPASLRAMISKAVDISRFMRVPATVTETGLTTEAADIMVGQCPAMQEIYKAIGRVAPQDVTVLITGESGTGKELAARALYHYSKRAKGPFLAINCAAIPENLLESELFGHEKGAFTSADRRRIGKFEQCNGGALFLDEIGDMAPLTQAKILRVLQDKQFERVGGNETIQTDVRIIAATNSDLEAMIAAGAFRSDLYYRLNTYTIKLPPLRERGRDLGLLAEHFIRRFGRELGKEQLGLDPRTLELLERYSWPGNVRELQSVIKQAIVHTSGPRLLPEFLPASFRGEALTDPSINPRAPQEIDSLGRFIEDRLQAGSTDLHAEFLARTEKQLFLHVLRHTEYNLSHAARILGISRATLRNKMIFLGITIDRSIAVEPDTTDSSSHAIP